jgi:uncharacterized protein YndB with AHSA1/START domain
MAEYSITRTYDAAPERVFDAWLDPAIARRFLFATRTGEMIRAETDPRVGGKFTFTDRRPDMGDVLHTGEYLELDRPKRIAFTFGVPQVSPDFTRVTLDFTPTAGGGCELRLTHSDVPAEWIERSQQGWAMILGWLGDALS